MKKIICIAGKFLGHEYDLPEGGVSFGRSKQNGIYILDDKLSRFHGQIVNTDGVLELEDYNSTNGTFLNGESITGKNPIKGGDLIEIGDHSFQVYDTTLNSSDASSVADLLVNASGDTDCRLSDLSKEEQDLLTTTTLQLTKTVSLRKEDVVRKQPFSPSFFTEE